MPGPDIDIRSRDLREALKNSSIAFHGVAAIEINQRPLENDHGEWFCGDIVFKFTNKDERDFRIAFHGDQSKSPDRVPIVIDEGPDNESVAQELINMRHKIAIAVDVLQTEIF